MLHLTLTLIFACAAPLAGAAMFYSTRELVRAYPVIRRALLALEG